MDNTEDELFPVDINIEDVRESIKGRIDFMEIQEGDLSIFTYILLTEGSFPDPKTVRNWIYGSGYKIEIVLIAL
jgi:hypothetical protein